MYQGMFQDSYISNNFIAVLEATANGGLIFSRVHSNIGDDEIYWHATEKPTVRSISDGVTELESKDWGVLTASGQKPKYPEDRIKGTLFIRDLDPETDGDLHVGETNKQERGITIQLLNGMLEHHGVSVVEGQSSDYRARR